MGRLIDADRLQKQFDEKSTNPNYRVNMHNIKSIICNAPSIDAIPKADYETRLKADLVAMLTELQVGIGEHINPSNHTDSYEDGWSEGAEWCIDYIQERINSLKEK